MPATIQLNTTIFDAGQAPAHQSLLDFIRETAGLKGTKEGCASGDCGACTVILRDASGANPHNINSCITPVGAAIGKQVITVEGAGTPQRPHPVQQALIDEHGSQCGFCTPGFVMSLVAAQLRAPASRPSRDSAIESVSGNLCRCTGYRPIIDAALQAEDGTEQLPATAGNVLTEPARTTRYQRPESLDELLAALKETSHRRSLSGADESDAPWLIAGATDAFLEVSQRYLDPSRITDLSCVAELREIQTTENGDLLIGSAVTHAQALDYFLRPETKSPAITETLKRFGSPQIRGRGTLGGNIANASPIADWPPLLIALDASLNLISATGEERTVRLDQFYLGYKATQLQPNEVIKSVQIPNGKRLSSLHAHKISKRFEDDISSTMAALYLELDGSPEQKVRIARIAFGGVGPTPLRCRKTEAVLVNNALTPALIDVASKALGLEITPMSDVRASENYRRQASQAVLRNLLQPHLLQGESA